jgi:hypothetical protein
MKRRTFITMLGGAATKRKGHASYSNRLNRIPSKPDPLLPSEQLQPYKHPLVRT